MRYALADPLLDFTDEGFGARELIALNRRADEFELMLGDATFDKLAVTLLSEFRGRREGEKAGIRIQPCAVV